MISEVFVGGFRGIREGLLRGLGQVTILLGRNGAGKSSLLEALYLASACASMTDEVRAVSKLDYVVSRRGQRGTWNGSRRVLWHLGEAEEPMRVRLGIGGRVYELRVLDRPQGERPVRLFTGGGLVDLETGHTFLLRDGVVSSSTVTSITGELDALRRLLKGFLLVDDVLLRSPGRVERYAWARVAAKRLDKRVVEMVREEFESEAEGLTYMPSEENYYYLALQTAKTTVRVDDLGDGARAALLASMLILAYKPTLLLLEEPELHMHPAGLYTYMKFLFRLAREQGFQVIASTHSLELVKLAQALSEETGVELAVQYVERTSDGVLEVRSFTPGDLDALEKLGIDVRLLDRF